MMADLQSFYGGLRFEHDLKAETVQARLDMLGALYGVKIVSASGCTGCGHLLEPGEILVGLTESQSDMTTACPKCGVRFLPKLAVITGDGGTEFPFLCSSTCLGSLKDLKDQTPAKIAQEQPENYWAAIFHFGTLARAFRRIDVVYGLEPKLDWKTKLLKFLGHVPDGAIADVLNVSRAAIQKWRNQQDLPRYKRGQQAKKKPAKKSRGITLTQLEADVYLCLHENGQKLKTDENVSRVRKSQAEIAECLRERFPERYSNISNERHRIYSALKHLETIGLIVRVEDVQNKDGKVGMRPKVTHELSPLVPDQL